MSEYIVSIDGQIPDALYERELVEIIRCRDCRHCNDEGVLSHVYFCVSDHFTGPGEAVPTDPDGFCAWAERREQ